MSKNAPLFRITIHLAISNSLPSSMCLAALISRWPKYCLDTTDSETDVQTQFWRYFGGCIEQNQLPRIAGGLRGSTKCIQQSGQRAGEPFLCHPLRQGDGQNWAVRSGIACEQLCQRLILPGGCATSEFPAPPSDAIASIEPQPRPQRTSPLPVSMPRSPDPVPSSGGPSMAAEAAGPGRAVQVPAH